MKPNSAIPAPSSEHPQGLSTLAPTESPRLSGRTRIKELDGLRGLAILLVLTFHLNLLQGANSSGSLVDGWFVAVANVGWCGVDLFFVLSGFLITGILYDAKNQPGYFKNFYARRVLRIFPLYYGVLILTFWVIPNIPDSVVPAEKLDRFGRVEISQLWYWCYLSNFAIANVGTWWHGILDVTWSLAIEEQFYLVWPIIVLLMKRRQLMKACAMMMAIALATRILMTISGCNPIATYIGTPARIDSLAAGAFVALLARSQLDLERWRPIAIQFSLASAGILLALFLWRGGLRNMDATVQTVGLTLVSIQLASFLVVVMTAPSQGVLSRILCNRFLVKLGTYSYAIYLFHMPLRALIRDAVYGPQQFLTLFGSRIPGQILFYLIATALTFSVASLSWHFYEKHFLKLKRHFR